MKVERIRLADQVVTQIQRMIATKQFNHGDKLPIENELASMFEVSRVTIREAISKLSVMGIIDVRQGDGTFVKSLTVDSFMKPLLSMLTMSNQDIKDVFEVRQLLEIKAVELAAVQGTSTNLDKMREYLLKMDEYSEINDLRLFNKYDALFHYEIAVCSGNNVLASINILLMDLIVKSIEASTTYIDSMELAKKYHHEIFNAIESNDPQVAIRAMTTHLKGGSFYVNTVL